MSERKFWEVGLLAWLELSAAAGWYPCSLGAPPVPSFIALITFVIAAESRYLWHFTLSKVIANTDLANTEPLILGK